LKDLVKNMRFRPVKNDIDFVQMEHEILNRWDRTHIFEKLVEQNKGNPKWSFLDGPITANNPMGVHHAWGRTLKDIFQRYHALKGFDQRYQNGFDCQGLWVEVEVEKELGFKSKKEVEEFGIEKFVRLCKKRVEKFSKIQTEQSKRLGYWMDWDHSYYTMSDENNYTIWMYLKKLFERGKIRKGFDVVPWSGKSGTSYSQMEIIEGRKLVAHRAVFVRFQLVDRKNEYLLIWTTTPWTLTSNVAVAINMNLIYQRLRASDSSIYYLASDTLDLKRLEKQYLEKKQWVENVPKLKTIAQIFKEKGGYTLIGTIPGSDMIGWKYVGPFDELPAQSVFGGYPFRNKAHEKDKVNGISCHRVVDGGKDSVGQDIVVAGEGTGIVHIAPGCGDVDNKIGAKYGLVNIAPLDDQSRYLEEFGWLSGKLATDPDTTTDIINRLRETEFLIHVEKYPHVYPHCWRSGDELVFRMVTEWYINMDWRDDIKRIVKDIRWIPEWGRDREMEWLSNMGDWMISKKRFWGLALPIWTFEDGTFHVVGSREELKELAVEGWDEFEGQSPHRPWIDKVKIRHPETGLIGTRVPDVGNPWLDAGIVPYSTLKYNDDPEYWKQWFPADLVLECFPGQFRNWFYSLLAMSTVMENTAPFKTILGHALVKDEKGNEMHKSWGNAIWFDEAAEKMGVDVMRWMFTAQNPEHNLLFGYKIADETRKHIITLWNTYSFFVTYANLDQFDPLAQKAELDAYTVLDRWILAKVNELVRTAETCYEEYKVFKLMQYATEFVDDLSNWYVRRNRRRFWKSDNDSDKTAAYQTLYETLLTFSKIMSPVIPFITEHIYQNLVRDVNPDTPESIHLTTFPKYKNEFCDAELIEEIDAVKQIVNLGRSARNKANIKIRQPLSKMIVYSGNEKLKQYIHRNSCQIAEELNLKSVQLTERLEDIVIFDVKPNYQSLREKYTDELRDVIRQIQSAPVDDLVKQWQAGQTVLMGNGKYELTMEDLIIEETAIDGFSANSDHSITVGIDIRLTNELKQEGIIRDLVRHIQNLRKDSGLMVEDRITVYIESDKTIDLALESYGTYLLNEVLGVNLLKDCSRSKHFLKLIINGIPVTIGISKANISGA